MELKQSSSKDIGERRDLPLGVGKKRIKNNAELNKLTDTLLKNNGGRNFADFHGESFVGEKRQSFGNTNKSSPSKKRPKGSNSKNAGVKLNEELSPADVEEAEDDQEEDEKVQQMLKLEQNLKSFFSPLLST